MGEETKSVLFTKEVHRSLRLFDFAAPASSCSATFAKKLKRKAKKERLCTDSRLHCGLKKK